MYLNDSWCVITLHNFILPDFAFFMLDVQNKKENVNENINIPVTKAELRLLVTAFNVRPNSLYVFLLVYCHQSIFILDKVLWTCRVPVNLLDIQFMFRNNSQCCQLLEDCH